MLWGSGGSSGLGRSGGAVGAHLGKENRFTYDETQGRWVLESSSGNTTDNDDDDDEYVVNGGQRTRRNTADRVMAQKVSTSPCASSSTSFVLIRYHPTAQLPAVSAAVAFPVAAAPRRLDVRRQHYRVVHPAGLGRRVRERRRRGLLQLGSALRRRRAKQRSCKRVNNVVAFDLFVYFFKLFVAHRR
jgi:hypothetical protein